MRVRFDLEAIRDTKPLKSARYQEHQPHEDSVFFTVPAEYITPIYHDSLRDHLTTWRRRGFRVGKIPKSWLPKAHEDVRESVCRRVASRVFNDLQPRLDPQPMIPPQFFWTAWTLGEDLFIKARYFVHPHTPDPMQMFNLEIPLEDDPLKLAMAMNKPDPSTTSGAAPSQPELALPPNILPVSPAPLPLPAAIISKVPAPISPLPESRALQSPLPSTNSPVPEISTGGGVP